MGSCEQQLEVKWGRHQSNLSDAFAAQQRDQAFVDVTLVCSGNENDESGIKAHRNVLSASSPFLRRIFMDNPHPHPVVVLHGLQHRAVAALVDFMYCGHISTTPDQLDSILTCAHSLQVGAFVDACHLTQRMQSHLNVMEPSPEQPSDQSSTWPPDSGPEIELLETTKMEIVDVPTIHVPEVLDEIIDDEDPPIEIIGGTTADNRQIFNNQQSDRHRIKANVDRAIGSVVPTKTKSERKASTAVGPKHSVKRRSQTTAQASWVAYRSEKHKRENAVVAEIATQPSQRHCCPLCGKTFVNLRCLRGHSQLHNPFRKTHACALCPRVYQRRAELLRHYRAMHPNEPLPYVQFIDGANHAASSEESQPHLQ